MKLRDSSGGTNFTLPVSNGLLRPEHVKRMGDAVWLELLLEDMVTTGRGEDGIVLGGRPALDRDLAARLGVSQRTIARYREQLLDGYIVAVRESYGYSYRVLKSKKWAAIRHSRSDKSVQSHQTKVSDHPPSDQTQSVGRSDTTCRSNKETKSGHIKKPIRPDKTRQVDPRFQSLIDAYFEGTKRLGIEPSCDGSDFGHLRSWLKANPRRTIESVLGSLGNAMASTEQYPLSPGFRLREFLQHESKYQLGPRLKPVPRIAEPIRAAPVATKNELSPEGAHRLEEFGVVQ